MPVRTCLSASLMAVAILVSGPLAFLNAQEHSEEHAEPFLKFLDDLRCFPHRTCHRNPYEERIETERHDFTQSTETVGCGVVQIEGGYSYFYKDNDAEIEHTHVTPEMLLRYGLSDDIEFRIRWTYGWRFVDEADNLDSAQDLIWSLKVGMTEQCGWIPESALEIRSSVPTGGSAWTLGRVEAGFDYIFEWELKENWELYGSVGYLGSGLGDVSLLPEEPESDDFDVWTTSLAIGKELSENSKLYVEWFGLFSTGLEEEFSVAVFNIGVDYYLSDNVIFDLRVGKGLTDDTDDFFTGIGGGVRY